MTGWRWLAVCALLIALGAIIDAATKPARAHDPYGEWRQPDNPAVSCCSADEDCRPTRAYFGDDGLWWAFDGRRFVPVPPSRVLPPDFAGDGRSHLCEKLGYIYCFTAGPVRG